MQGSINDIKCTSGMFLGEGLVTRRNKKRDGVSCSGAEVEF